MQDILADSDSDLDDDMEVDSQPVKKTKRSETYIQEDPENIVDLADINSIGKITCKLFGPTKRKRFFCWDNVPTEFIER